jgi:hypothetical protein
VAEGIAASVSTSTIRRWLAKDAIKPWQHQSWIFINDPSFAVEATRVLDLHHRVWDGKPLSANEHAISADEETSIQAGCRCHPCLPPGKDRRHAYQPRLPPRRHWPTWPPTTSTGPRSMAGATPRPASNRSTALVKQVRTQEPYASPDRVFWVVDNGSSHRGQRAIDRLAEKFPDAVMMHTPVHASWLTPRSPTPDGAQSVAA